MALRVSYAKKEDIPEALAALYVEKDGKWVLEVDGMVPSDDLAALKTKVDDFRTNNIKLAADLKAFDGKKVLTQEEVEEYQVLADQAQSIKDKKLIDAGKLDELLSSRTDKMRTDFEKQITSLNDSLEKVKAISATHAGRLSKVMVESEVGKILSKSGNRPIQGALDDIFSRAGGTWRTNEEGKLVALDSKGEPVYGGEGKVLTLDEWLVQTVKDAPYLFEVNKGGGGDGGKGGDNKGSDGIIRVPRSDEAMKGKYIKELAEGKAIMVD